METSMELDDFKQAWQTLDRRLEQQNRLQLQQYRENKFDKMRHGMRSLRWGQALQMILGAVIMALSVAFWRTHGSDPYMLATGIVMHAYGIATIVAGGVVLGGLSEIDHSSPVLAIQKQLAIVRKRYVISGLCVGLPWWMLWVLPLVMLAKAVSGINLFVQTPGFVWSCLGAGVLGMLATWWLHHWSRDSSRPRLAKFMDDSLTGANLRRAQSILDEVIEFERT